MPLKDGPMLRDDEIDMSTASKTDKRTCNKLICKLGYRQNDNIRYPKLIQQVYSRLRTEENGDGNRAQNRSLYKKLTQCSSNYETPEDIPTPNECATPDNWDLPQRPKEKEKKRAQPEPKKPFAPQDVILQVEDTIEFLKDFATGPYLNDEIKTLNKRISAMDIAVSHVGNEMVRETKFGKFRVVLDKYRQNFADACRIIDKDCNKYTMWDELKKYIDTFSSLFKTYVSNFNKHNNKGKNKSKKSPPPPPKDPTPPPKDPTPPRNSSKRKKCPKGSRRNKKTGNCDSTAKNKEPTPPHKPPTPPPNQSRRSSSPRNNSKRKRCPNGTRRNKKTGNCDPTK